MNYFAIECNGQFRENVILRDSDGNVVFTDYLEKDYEAMKYSTDLEEFVCAVMEACEELGGDQVALTLIGEDDVFIWGIIMGYDEDDMLRYSLVDWKQDGQNYRYEP